MRGVSLCLVMIALVGCGTKPPDPGPEDGGSVAACLTDSDCAGGDGCSAPRCEAGACASVPFGTDVACDDGDPSTLGDHCDGAGGCAPGGKAAIVGQAGYPSLYVQPLDGGRAQSVVPAGTGSPFIHEGIGASGAKVIYGTEGPGGYELFAADAHGASAAQPTLLDSPEAGWFINSAVAADSHVFHLAARRVASGTEVQVRAASLTGDPAPHAVSPVYLGQVELHARGDRAVYVVRTSTGVRVYSTAGSGTSSSAVALGPEHDLLAFLGINPSGDPVYGAAESASPSDWRVLRASPGIAGSETQISTRSGLRFIAADEGTLWVALDDPADGLGNTLCTLRTDLSMAVDPCAKDSNGTAEPDRHGPLAHPGGYAHLAYATVENGQFKLTAKLTDNDRWLTVSLHASGAQETKIILGAGDGAGASFLGFLAEGTTRHALFQLASGAVIATRLDGSNSTSFVELVPAGRVARRWLQADTLAGLVVSVVTDQNEVEIQHLAVESGAALKRALPLRDGLDEPLAHLENGRLLIRSRRAEKWPLLVTAVSGSQVGQAAPVGDPLTAGALLHVTADHRLVYSEYDRAKHLIRVRPLAGGAATTVASSPEPIHFAGVDPTGAQALLAMRSSSPGEWRVYLAALDGSDAASPLPTGATMQASYVSTKVRFSGDGSRALVQLRPDRVAPEDGECTGLEKLALGGAATPGAIHLVGLKEKRGVTAAYGPAGTNQPCDFFAQGTKFFFIRGSTGYLASASLDEAPSWTEVATNMVSGCEALSPDRTTIYYRGQALSACENAADVINAYQPEQPGGGLVGVHCAPLASSYLRAVEGGVIADVETASDTGKRYFLRAGGEDSKLSLASVLPVIAADDRFLGVSYGGEYVLSVHAGSDSDVALSRPKAPGGPSHSLAVEPGVGIFALHGSKPSLLSSRLAADFSGTAVAVRQLAIATRAVEASWTLPPDVRPTSFDSAGEGVVLRGQRRSSGRFARSLFFLGATDGAAQLVPVGPSSGPATCKVVRTR